MKKNFRFVLVALATLLVASLLVGCAGDAAPASEGAESSASVIDKIKDEGVIRIAVPEDTPLFGIVGADGTHEGYDVEVAQRNITHISGPALVAEQKDTGPVAPED